jgi:hypothetical protein
MTQHDENLRPEDQDPQRSDGEPARSDAAPEPRSDEAQAGSNGDASGAEATPEPEGGPRDGEVDGPEPEHEDASPGADPGEAPEASSGEGEEPAGEESFAASGSADLPGSEFGFIDEEGRVWVKETPRMEARVIGKAKGRDPQVTFKFFVDRFKKLEALTTTLEEQIRDTENKGRFSERVGRLIERVRTAQALGDYESLLARLEALRDLVFAFQADVRQRKERLCEQAEALADSTDWKRTGEKLKQLQREWKSLGSASRADDERLWSRFRGALDHFFDRRDEDRKQRREQQERAKATKIALCEEAEQLAESTDWGATSKRQDELMEAWKAAGSCGRGEEKRLWERFRAARTRFFEARRTSQKEQRQRLEENRRRKDGLCESAEALVEAENVLDACEQAKLLQKEWKEIGPSPRAVSQPQWERFRGALDKVFERGRLERRKGRDRRQQVRQEGVSRKREKAEKLRESITRDQGHLERWRHATAGLGDEAGGLREELEQKIASVEQQLEEKQRSLAELEKEIRQEAEG